MKKHDHLKTTESAAARDERDKQWRTETFERFAADPGQQWRDDGCGAVVAWEEVSAANKCVYMAYRAASCDVSFARLAKAVTHALGGRELTANEQKHLRSTFAAARTLLAPMEPEAELGFHAMVIGFGSRGGGLGNGQEKERGAER